MFSADDFGKKVYSNNLEKDLDKIAKLEALGLPILVFYAVANGVNCDGELEDFEIEAIEYINSGIELPPELEKRLLDTLEARRERDRQQELLSKAVSAGVKTLDDIKRVYGLDLENQTYMGLSYEEALKNIKSINIKNRGEKAS